MRRKSGIKEIHSRYWWFFFLLDISEKSDTTNEGLNVQMKNWMENLNLDRRICNLEDKSLEIAQ